MKLSQINNTVLLWWGSALFTSCFHIYLLWLLASTVAPVKHAENSPVAMMVALSAETEFTQISEQRPVVGLAQSLNEPVVEQSESQPEEVDNLLTAPEQSHASLIVDQKTEPPKKKPSKVKLAQSKVIKPRLPVTESMPDNHSEPTSPAVSVSAPLSGDSHRIAAAANSDSSHLRDIKMSWRGRLQGHLMNFKRYPPGARKKHQQGTPAIRFVVNQDGYVLSAQLVNSSKFRLLDSEALELIKRAQPLPKPPAELLSQGQITITMPIGFNLTDR